MYRWNPNFDYNVACNGKMALYMLTPQAEEEEANKHYLWGQKKQKVNVTFKVSLYISWEMII